MRKFIAALMCVAFGVVAAPAIGAVPLGLGQFAHNSDLTVVPGLSQGAFTGTGVPANFSILVASMTSPFPDDGADDYSGSVTSTVWRDPSTGCLAFEYSYIITGGTSPSPTRSATIGGNWSLTAVTDVGSDGSGLSTATGGTGWTDGDPALIGRLDASGDGAPSIVFDDTFSLSDGTSISPGEFSAKFWYATDAKTYAVDSFDMLDGGDSADAPVYVVPAPGAILLGVIGMGLVGWSKRRNG